MTGNDSPPICDYDGSDYRTRFWENQGREYEDLAERIAIRRLLPPAGCRMLEIGTGFGRLVDMYQGYDHVVLLDYSKSLLREARERLGTARYTYVAADIYRMPLSDGAVDAVSMVRVMHHIADVPEALRHIYRVLRPGGFFLLEFASKLHLKSILRHAVRRQDWSPYALDPVEFVPLNYDFHPRWMRSRLQEQGFAVDRVRAVSLFRIPLLKRAVPARLLATADGALQWTGQLWPCAPSIFVRAQRPSVPGRADLAADLFVCPNCSSQQWETTALELHCLSCDARWQIDDGIYDFRKALA